MKKTTALVALLIICFLGAGCRVNLNLGKRFDRDAVKDILPGRTTKEWVREKFGRPQEVYGKGNLQIYCYKFINEKGTHHELIVSMNGELVSNFHLK